MIPQLPDARYSSPIHTALQPQADANQRRNLLSGGESALNAYERRYDGDLWP